MTPQLNFKEKLERYVRDFRDKYMRRYKHEKLPPEIFDANLPKLSVSFCTTCMNRLFHLKQTFISSIQDNINYPNVEFVLINYNSQDGLEEWAQKTLKPYIDKGIVNYYRTPEPKSFHISKAKNLAHKVAKGDIVVNLDGDNFAGKDFAFYANYIMQKRGDNTIFQFKKAPFWGTEGRIVLMKKYFMELGGYDESLEGIGHEDHDLMDRGKAIGMKYENIQIENFLHYLSNTTKEKSQNVADNPDNYYGYESRNRVRSQENIAAGKVKANPDGWALFPLYKNFSAEARVY
ncbi:MAG TPA: glycosyltransferase family A protein [Ohtaekwangia sp.]